MARLADRLPENAPGDLYVDRSCIDCATCREMVPSVFSAGDGFSYVSRQPDGEARRLRALMALVACPTGSIVTVSKPSLRAAIGAFPEPVAGDVSFCGFTSERSFGAWSYLIRRPAGNVLVDVPRAAAPLLERLEALGGVSLLLLTHRDDVADHAAFRKRFGCERVIHAADAAALGETAERLLDGTEPVRLDDDLLAIPTPGHTAGHVAYLYRDAFLFSGDHLAHSPRQEGLTGFRDACWHSWDEQLLSFERLLPHDFAWVLPGHGERFHAPSPERMREEVRRLLARYGRVPAAGSGVRRR